MKTKPRVLLLSATSGAGHVRAAQAFEKAFLARGDCAVEHVDALQHVSKLFQRVYDKAYISMVRRRPGIEGRPLRPHGPAVAARAAAPCAGCVATHFLPAAIIAYLIAKRKLHARHAIVVTDYDVHAMWLCRTVDRCYCTLL